MFSKDVNTREMTSSSIRQSALGGNHKDDGDEDDKSHNRNSGSTAEKVLVGQPSWLSTESYAVCLLVLSAILTSFMASFVHLTTMTSDVSSAEVVFIRTIFQGFFVVAAMLFLKADVEGDEQDDDDDDEKKSVLLIQQPFGSAKVRSLVIARGMAGGVAIMLSNYTMSVLPVGDAMTLIGLTPVLTIVAGLLFLSEPAKLTHWFAVIASLLGSLLLAQPSFLFPSDDEDSSTTTTTGTTDNKNLFGLSGYVTGPLGACCGAAVTILIRYAGKIGVHTLQLLFSLCCFGVLNSIVVGVIGPILFGTGMTFVIPSNFTTWMYIIGTCTTGSFAHLLFNYCAQHTPAGISSIIRSSKILWSYILEVIIFHEIPAGTTLMGVALIVVSLIAIALEKIQQQQQAEEEKSASSAITMLTAQIYTKDDNNYDAETNKSMETTTTTTDFDSSIQAQGNQYMRMG